ncbi:MAG: GAF domain-containing protein, partial [Pseudolabrys sp.]
MQRRGGSEQPVKGQRHKTIRPKARKAPTAPASADHSAEQFDRLKRERDEALEQLAATSGVLEAISKSTFDLKAVLQGLVESAARLCKADKAAITRQIGGEFFFTETYGLSSEFIEHVRTVPVKPKRGTVSGLALLEGRTIHVSDLRVPRDDIWAKAQKLGGFRTMLGVPMLREGTPIGVLALVRTEAQPFTNKQIELVQNFAAQAVIAIENTRLLSELRQRTDDLSESLEQQTATSEVLKVISSSPGELKPVFDTMLINAMQVCEAKFGFMHRYEDDNWETMALQCDVPAYAEFVQKARFGPESIVGRIASTKQVAQVADITATQRYADRDPLAVAAAEIGGVRTILGVPVLKENEVKGAIILYRQEVRPFTNKQIELVQNFAAQAVIAIENARLLSELRESLQQQTATADVLKVISSSPGDLGPVFDTMLANAVHVCGANFGIMHRYDGGAFCNVAMHNVPPAFAEMRRSNPVIRPSPGTGLGRVERTKKVVQILDLKSEQTYRDRVPATVAMVELAGARTLLLVPMLKDDVLLGTIAIYRQEVRPFSDKQIELVENFSAQAVIAIENTRLLNELRESLEQQTATSEVLKVISSSPGELEPVFNAMLANATRICEATIGTLYLREGSAFRGVALHHSKQSYVDFWRRNPVVDVKKNPGIPLDRLARTKRVVHIPDLRTDQSYIEKNDRIVILVEQADVRTFVAVPMLKEGELIGAINLYRQKVRPFTDKQIALVQNFAAQAVIAIENTR